MLNWIGRLGETRALRRGFDRAAFLNRLAGFSPSDPLREQVLALCDAYVLEEAEALSAPGVSDAELRRLSGRLGMLLQLRRSLDEAWTRAHSPKPT